MHMIWLLCYVRYIRTHVRTYVIMATYMHVCAYVTVFLQADPGIIVAINEVST